MSSSSYDNEAFFHQLLQKAVAAGASDMHIKVGQPRGRGCAATWCTSASTASALRIRRPWRATCSRG